MTAKKRSCKSEIKRGCFVYILRSLKDNGSYVGYSCDANHRLRQHNGEISGGGRYTSFHRPWVLHIAVELPAGTQGDGLRLERVVKKARGGAARTRTLLRVGLARGGVVAHPSPSVSTPTLSISSSSTTNTTTVVVV